MQRLIYKNSPTPQELNKGEPNGTNDSRAV
jgi:hypothetical protein